jgi:hypothetical protein
MADISASPLYPKAYVQQYVTRMNMGEGTNQHSAIGTHLQRAWPLNPRIGTALSWSNQRSFRSVPESSLQRLQAEQTKKCAAVAFFSEGMKLRR